MFGPDGAFLNTMLSLMRWLPVYPMFDRDETRLQPAFVYDVAEAIPAVLQRPGNDRGSEFWARGVRRPGVPVARACCRTIKPDLSSVKVASCPRNHY